MFATQQYIEAVDAGRKRFRDDEDTTLITTGFGEHRNVRDDRLTRVPPQQSLLTIS